MIISLEQAQAINPAITIEDLYAYEQAIRALTHNNFQDPNVRGQALTLHDHTIQIDRGYTTGLKIGDTVEINYTRFNDGIYTIKALTPDTIEVNEGVFFNEISRDAIVTKISYPADIAKGVKKLISYDLNMGNKVGIKSEAIARMSVTYYDVNNTENVEGYPAALLSFIKKYRKMRW